MNPNNFNFTNIKPPLLSIQNPSKGLIRPIQVDPSQVQTRAANVPPTQQDVNRQFGGVYQSPSPTTDSSTPKLWSPKAVLGPQTPPASVGNQAISPDSNVPPQAVDLPAGQIRTSSATSSNNGLIGSFPALVGDLANSSRNSAEVSKAMADKLAFEKAYSDIQTNIGSRPNPFGFQTGVGQLEKNRYAQLEPAYTQNVNNALQQQSQRISGLGTAAGLAAPQSLTPTQQPYYPVEGQFAGDQTQGQRILRASNLQSISDLNGPYLQQQSNLAGIKGLESDLNNFMGVSGVNPTTFPIVNSFINTVLQKGVGDSQYKILGNYMSDLATRYSTYFGANSQVTNQVRDVANSLINGNAKADDIMKVLQSLGSQAEAVQQGTYNQINSLISNPGQVSPPSSSYNPTAGGGLYDF